MRASRELRNALNEVFRRLPNDEALADAAAAVADLLDRETPTSSSPGPVAADAGPAVEAGVRQERERAAEIWRGVAAYARLAVDARHVRDR